jgi:hypothetical protein
LWSSIIESKYEKLLAPLDQADPARLAETLVSMFREGFMFGISMGDLYTHGQTKIGSRVWSLRYLDQIVSLAEFLGVVRTETPEQGVTGYALQEGLDELVARIERALGMPVGFPEVGAPYGIKSRGSLITMEAPEHIYVALRINQAIDLYLDGSPEPDTVSKPKIVEIGAGFGGTAYWLLKMKRAVGSYTIIDLPLINVLQGYFLSKVFGESKVSLFGEGQTEDEGQPLIAVLPTHSTSYRTTKFDVLINQNSMPEMPEQSVEDYLSWARNNLRGIFYSYNQEAYSPFDGVIQNLVPEIAGRIGGFKLLTRNCSWLRCGYVEEVYLSEEDDRGRTDQHPV